MCQVHERLGTAEPLVTYTYRKRLRRTPLDPFASVGSVQSVMRSIKVRELGHPAQHIFRSGPICFCWLLCQERQSVTLWPQSSILNQDDNGCVPVPRRVCNEIRRKRSYPPCVLNSEFGGPTKNSRTYKHKYSGLTVCGPPPSLRYLLADVDRPPPPTFPSLIL